MALEVGELVAFLRLDDKDFTSKLSSSGGALQRFGQGAQRVLQPVATGFAAGTTAAAGLASALLAQGVAYNTLQQSSRAALTTILGSAEKANAQMDKLDEFARSSPFAKQVFIQAQQQLLGFGVAAEDVIPALSAIQDSVAAVGGSNEDISNVTYALAQMQGQGKLTGETLNILGQYGIDAATILGEKMGKTGQEIRDMASKPGGIPVDQVWDPLVSSLTEKFGGAAEGVKNTWIGATDRIKGATRDIGSALAAPFVDPQGGGKALDWANAFADLLRAVEGQAKPLIEVLLPKILPLADGITARLEDAAAAVKGLDIDQLIAQLGGLGEYATPLAAVAAALFAMGTQAAPIQALGLSLNPVAAALVAIIAASPDARGAVLDLLSAFSGLKDEAGDLLLAAGDLGNVLVDGLVQILTAVTGTATETGGAMDLLALGLDGLTGAIQFVTGVIDPLVGFLTDLIGAASGVEGPILAVVAALVLLRGVDVGGVVSKLTDAFSTGKQTWDASKATLEALGDEAGLMNTAMMSARSGVTSLGGALKGLMVANAPMLAITALAGAVGFFIQEAAEAKAMADQLTDTFDELDGSATASTDRMILTQLNEQLDAGDWEQLRQIGYSYTDVVNAIKEGGPAYDQLWADLDNTRLAQNTWTQAGRDASGAMSRTMDALRDVGPAYRTAAEQAEVLAGQNQELEGAVDDAGRAMTGAEQNTLRFRDALAVISDEASSADEKLRALNDIMDIIAGASVSAADAAFAYAETVEKTAAAVEELALSKEDLDSILNDDGSLNTQSQAARALRGEFKTLSDDANVLAVSLAEAGDVEGVQAAYQGLYDDIQALAEAAGLGAEETNALMLSLGILPPEVMTDIVVNGTESEVDVNRLGDALNGLPPEVVSAIYGDTDGLDSAVDHSALQLAYLAGLSADPMIGADDTENLEIVSAAMARLDEIDGMEPTPELRAEKRLLEDVVAGAKIDLDSVPDKTAQVIAETYGFSSVEALRREIERLRSKTIQVRTQFITSGSRPSVSRPGTHTATLDADGSVHLPRVKSFGDGGVEHRVAQIAPAGAWRIWAEEETGGEAYVPLALAKRARSLAIMHDVAARFGHVMVPVNARRFADGGSTAPHAIAQPGVGMDYAAMGAEMRAAVAGMSVQMNIDGRTFYGLVIDSGKAARAPFVTRRS